MKRPATETVLPYGVAIAAGVVSLLLWEAIGKHLGATPYLFDLAAVMVASWMGGLAPGLLATVWAGLLSLYFAIAPTYALSSADARASVLLGLFLVLGFAICWLNEVRRRHERSVVGVSRQVSALLAAEREARAEAQAAESRALFLSLASNLLAGSLDYEATLQSVARLAVPQVADWCAVHIVSPTGTVRQIAVAHVDPAKVEYARELEKRFPYDPESPVGVPQVLRTGKAELITEIPDELLEALGSDPEMKRIVRELGLNSSMVVPLIARGNRLGAISFIGAESGRRFGKDDLALAEELADRAALAVDNARLYREAQRVGAERQAILRSMADGVAIADASGTITFLNEAARRMLGNLQSSPSALSVFAITGVKTLEGLPLPPDKFPLARALRHRVTVETTYWRLTGPDGNDTIFQGNAAPVIDADGLLLGAVSAFRDVTAQWNLERQKDEFLSSAAHDLKTPLASIKGLAQITLRRVQRSDIPVDASVSHGLKQIDDAATRMTRQINELLDTARADFDRPLPLNRASVDLVALARGVVEHQGEIVDSHEIRLEPLRDRIEGHWDAERLERVLDNLLANAVKYSPSGGEVIVRLDMREDGGDCMAVLSVVDHGIGIPPADLPRVTERFYRASNVAGKIPGTGIGLAGAMQIVEQHGGRMKIVSEEQEGTTVTITLPVRGACESTGRDA